MNNSLQTREECPQCRHVFIAGYDPQNMRQCPGCQAQFVSRPKMNLYQGSNNVYYKEGCPALMSDGHFITNYNSSNELTEAIRKLNGFKSHNQFRIFMQENGDLFRNAERDHILKQNTCAPRIACSQGWHELWTKYGGNWAAHSVKPANAN